MTAQELRIAVLERQVRELKQMVCHLDQKLADERAERIGADKRAARQQQDREWMRDVA